MRLVGDRSLQVGARLVLTFLSRECSVLSAHYCIALTFVTWSEVGTVVCLSNVECFKA